MSTVQLSVMPSTYGAHDVNFNVVMVNRSLGSSPIEFSNCQTGVTNNVEIFFSNNELRSSLNAEILEQSKFNVHPSCPPKVESSTSSCSIKESNNMDFSEGNIMGCLRGELLLSDEEYENILKILETSGHISSWRFLALTESLPKRNRRLGKQINQSLSSCSRTTSGNNFNSKNNKIFESEAAEKTGLMTVENLDASGIGKGGKDVWPNELQDSQKAVYTNFDFPPFCRPLPSAVTYNQMADWSKQLHRIIFELCSTDECSPLVHDTISLFPRYMEFLNSINAGNPSCFIQILKNLEERTYDRIGRVIMDIYAIFTAAFRVFEPGSTLWMRVHLASVSFQNSLRDVFTNQNLIGMDRSSCEARKLDDFLKHILSNGREKRKGRKKPRTSTSKTTRRNAFKENRQFTMNYNEISSVPNKNCKNKKSRKNKSISEMERTEFQNLLANLPQAHHFELFNSFQNKAVWHALEGGEVELDDKGTSPSMFRKMVSWCRERIAMFQKQNYLCLPDETKL